MSKYDDCHRVDNRYTTAIGMSVWRFFNIGKYKNQKVKDVCYFNPFYVAWCLESSYIILKSFMEKHSKYFMKGTMYNVTAALALLSPLSSNNAEAAFRDGTLVITEEMVKKAMPTLNQLKLIGEILGARRGTGEADLSPFRRYRIKDWIRARDIMNISVDQFMNRLKRRVDSGRWEEPSEKNWFNSYIEVASLKR